MRTALGLLVVLTLLLAAGAAAATPPDLSGTWVPDLARYQASKELKQVDPKAPPAPPAPPAGPPELPAVRITQHGAELTLEYLEQDGGVISSLRLTTNGEENVNARGDGALTQRSRSRWQDGALMTGWKLERAGTEIMTGKDTWRLGADGGTLTQESTLEDSRSRSRTVTIYRRSPASTSRAAVDDPEVLALYDADQDDSRPYGTPEEKQATDARARARIERMTAAVRAGRLHTANDYYHAALVYQHGQLADDHLMAHLLATVAGFKGHPWGSWLSAASLDGLLLASGRPQVLGTIYGKDFQRYERALPDSLRREYCVPPLAVQERNQRVIAEHRGTFQRRAAECGE